MIKGSGYTLIGHAKNAGHLYHFTDALNALWCVYIDAFTGHGIIMKSRTQGLSWYQTDDVGRVDEITVRGGYAAYRLGPKVTVYDLDEGFQMFQHSYELPVPGGSADQTYNLTEPIPVPELGGVALKTRLMFSEAHYIYNIVNGSQGFGLGELVSLWGSQNNNIKFPNPTTDRVYYVWRYTDPFTPDSSYDVLNYAGAGGSGPVLVPPPENFGYPVDLPLGNAFHATGYEGFLSGRTSLTGVGVESRDSPPSGFSPADPWQVGTNTAPRYAPTLAAPGIDFTFPVQSVPSGVSYDQPYAKGAAYGIVGGYPTFGLFEPGSGLALCRLAGVSGSTGTIGGRKFLGNFPHGFTRSRIWMPFTNGIFGMGLIGHLGGSVQQGGSPAGASSLLWVYDREPDRIPARVVSKNGKFVEDDAAKVGITAKIDARSYVRW